MIKHIDIFLTNCMITGIINETRTQTIDNILIYITLNDNWYISTWGTPSVDASYMYFFYFFRFSFWALKQTEHLLFRVSLFPAEHLLAGKAKRHSVYSFHHRKAHADPPSLQLAWATGRAVPVLFSSPILTYLFYQITDQNRLTCDTLPSPFPSPSI